MTETENQELVIHVECGDSCSNANESHDCCDSPTPRVTKYDPERLEYRAWEEGFTVGMRGFYGRGESPFEATEELFDKIEKTSLMHLMENEDGEVS